MFELWAAIAGAPDYEVSTWGRVRQGDQEVPTWENQDGYFVVTLTVGSGSVLRYVHRLVLAAFIDPIEGHALANHVDGCKSRNAVENLEWTSPSGNVQHAWDQGLIPRTRARRLTCRFGHPRQQPYRQRDRANTMRKWVRCARCRRARYRRALAQARGQGFLFADSAR